MIKLRKIASKAGLTLATIAVVIAGAAAFSAFEAHIVNVTARIENALSVSTGAIDFGTVFPQEYLTDGLEIALSDSFMAEDRVDDVEYVIKQKPKVKAVSTAGGNPNENPTPGDPYATLELENFVGPAWMYCENNLPPDSNTVDGIGYTVDMTDEYWNYCYLPLANSLSKHKADDEANETNDTEIDAFHQAYLWDEDGSSLNPEFTATGRLAKSEGDIQDSWIIDLKVPCFYNMCAQEAFDPNNLVDDDIPGFAVPVEFQLDPATEHMVFGTDLWIEVTGVSEAPIVELPQVGAALGDFVQATACTDVVNEGESIQEAVDAATAGAVICVGEGTYNENVNINKSIVLTGDGADATSIINGVGGNQTGAIMINASNVTVEGFEINGHADGIATIFVNAAVSDIVIESNKLTVPSPDGFLAVGGVTNITVNNNEFIGMAGALRLSYVNGLASVAVSSDNVDLTNNTFGGTLTGTLAIGHEASNSTVSQNVFNLSPTYAVIEAWMDSIAINVNNFNGAGGLKVAQMENLSTGDQGTVNAEDNWWGAAVPAGHFSGDVDDDPKEVSAYPEN